MPAHLQVVSCDPCEGSLAATLDCSRNALERVSTTNPCVYGCRRHLDADANTSSVIVLLSRLRAASKSVHGPMLNPRQRRAVACPLPRFGVTQSARLGVNWAHDTRQIQS